MNTKIPWVRKRTPINNKKKFYSFKIYGTLITHTKKKQSKLQKKRQSFTLWLISKIPQIWGTWKKWTENIKNHISQGEGVSIIHKMYRTLGLQQTFFKSLRLLGTYFIEWESTLLIRKTEVETAASATS